MGYVISIERFFANLSPEVFRMWARHYCKCKQDFQPPDYFSPVPYFLLCRAIELELKSRHLQQKTWGRVKDELGGNLINAYNALEDDQKVLTAEEVKVMGSANRIYIGKGFEYFNPEQTLNAHSPFPNLASLDAVAKKLIHP